MSIAKRNKRRGKETEKRLIKRFAEIVNPIYVERTGILGEEDGIVILPNKTIIACECKSRKKLAFLKWWEQAKKAADKKNAMPIVLVQQYSSKKAFAIVELEDLYKLLDSSE